MLRSQRFVPVLLLLLLSSCVSFTTAALAAQPLTRLAGTPGRPAGAPASPEASGQTGAPATPDPTWAAYAHYEAGLRARARGDHDAAAREYLAAMQLQPQWASPHVSLAWSDLWLDPGAAPGELVQAVRLSAGSFAIQNLLAFHFLLWCVLAAFLALLALCASALLTALPDFHHRLSEFFSGYLDRAYAAVVAALAVVLPFALGVGVLLPLLFLLSALQQSMQGAARRLWAVLLVSTLALPWLVVEADSLLLARTPGSWAGRVERASVSRWSPGLASALREAEAQAPGRFELPFARGLMELRALRLDEAARSFHRADSLSPGDARVLNDLAVTEWMRGQGDAAEAALRAAVRSDERLTAAHYNLAQVLSRRLAFEDANREMLRAGALDFDRLRRHFDAYGAGRASMMLEEPSPEVMWKLWRDETVVRAEWTELPAWLAGYWETRPVPFACVALLVLILGSVAGRWLARWLPVYRCANCGAILCRRCSGRRRGETFCQVCLGHVTSTHGGPYARVLLERRHAQQVRERNLVTATLATVLPPVGRALARRWLLSYLSWLGFSFLVLATLRGGFWIHTGPRFAAGSTPVPVALCLGALWLAWWLPQAAAEFRLQRSQLQLDLGASTPLGAITDQAA